jgi:magnesium-transporting ATPase (P-type)
MWNKLSLYTRKYPSRISGYISALILYLHKYFPAGTAELIIPSVMIMVGLGEFSQRVEDKKTIKALYANNDPNVPDGKIIEDLSNKDSIYVKNESDY